MLIFGENNFAVRLPSSLAVGLSALLIFLLVNRGTEKEERLSEETAALAIIIFLTCFEVFGVGNTAVLDNLFAMFLTTAVIAFYAATEQPAGTAGEIGWSVLAGAAAGLAFLTKGFLAVALPVLVFVPYLVWQRRVRDIWRMGWLPVVTAVLVVLPWSVAIALREPDFWHFFFWNEHVRRFMAGAAQHKEPLWYFLMIAPAIVLPWSFLVPAAVKGLRDPNRPAKPQSHLVRLCICWLVLPFVFFSISRGKLVTYILPCFPPFAILMAIGLMQAVRQRREKSIQWGIAGTGILFAIVMVGILLIQFVGYQGFRLYSHPWKALMLVNGLFLMLLLCFLAFKSQLNMNKLLLFGLSPLLLFFVAHFTLPDQTMVAKAPGHFLEHIRSGIGQDAVVVSDEESVRASCWYLKRSDLYVLGGTGELDYGMAYADALHRLISLKAFKDLSMLNRGRLVLIARTENVERWKARLPKPAFMDSNGLDGYTIWKY